MYLLSSLWKVEKWVYMYRAEVYKYDQAGDTRIPLPRKLLWTPQNIVDCKVGLSTSLRTVAEFL